MKKVQFAKLLRPWIDRIKDEELREKVLLTFESALKKSGYSKPEQFLKMPFTLLTNCRSITFLEHTLAVTAGAVGLAQAQMSHYEKPPYEIEMDRLIAGGLLHDVGKIAEIEPYKDGYRKSRNGMCMRHPISGVALAYEQGLPPEVLNCIGCHAKEGEGRPQTVETVLIHQADYATFDPLVMLEKGSLIA